MRLVVYLLACAVAAVAPLVPHRVGRPSGEGPVPWPRTFEGRRLVELPLGERDQRFARDFPGRIGLFSDGSRQIVLRFTTRATRRLHPASDCLKAVGYAIAPLPARLGPDGTTWGCFTARKREELVVCEQIRDGAGATWPDPSTWYWPALFGSSRGPWWSTTVVERRGVR
jgi:hypothetical protein